MARLISCLTHRLSHCPGALLVEGSRSVGTPFITLVLTLPAYAESSIDKKGVRHSSPLTIKTEIVGLRFERTSMLPVPVLAGIIERCQRP